MAQPYEQDVILDADGKSLFTAVELLQQKINNIGKTISTIQKDSYRSVSDLNKTLDTNLKSLQTAYSQLRTLTSGDPKQKEINAAYKQRATAAKTAAAEESKAFSQAERQQAAEAKAYYSQIVEFRRSANKQMRDDEIAGEREVARQNAAIMAKELESAKLLRAARLEASKAAIIDKARGLTSIDDASSARFNNANRLRQLRAEAAAATDPAIQRDLAQRIELEKALGRQLDVTYGKLQRQDTLAQNRLAGFNTKRQNALIPSDVATAVASNPGGAAAQRSVYLADQLIAKEALLKAETAEEGAVALRNLEIANLRVAAVDKLVRAQARANQPAKQAQPTALQNILSPSYALAAFARTGIYGAAAGVAYALFDTVQSTITSVIKLEDEFAKLQAISNSTDKEMQGVKATIYGIGENSRFAVDDLVRISQTLAQAGVSAADLGKVLTAVTTLATASGSSPDDAVNLVTSALGAFQLQASESARVADLMTAALNRTKLTVTQVGQAIQYVGATAYEQNISLETLLATIGAVAQGGVKSGSTIGTGFRQFLVDLQTPSEKLEFELKRLGITQDEVNIKTRGLSAVLQTLKEKGFGATQAYDGLETRAAAFYLVAKNNTDVMDELQLSFAQSGAAAIANARSMDSLAAQWQRFRNILQEGFSSSLEAPMEALKQLLEALSNRILEMRKTALELKRKNADGSAGILDTDITPYLSSAIDKTLNVTGNVINGKDLVNGGTLASRFDPNHGWGEWLHSWGQSAKEAKAETELYADAIKSASNEVDKHGTIVVEVDKEMDRLRLQQSSLITNTKLSQAETVTLSARFDGLVKYLGTTKNAYIDLIQAMGQYRGEESRLLSQAYAGQVSAQQKQNNLDAAGLQSAIARIKNNPELLKLLTPQEQGSLNNPSDINFAARMASAAERIAKTNRDFANALNDAATLSSRLAVGTRTAERAREQAGLAAAAGTPLGQEATARQSSFQARLEALSSQDQATRTKSGNLLSTDIRSYIGALTPKLAVTTGTNKQFIAQTIEMLNSLLNQVAAAIKPSQDEIKEAKRQAAEQRREEAELRKRPNVTQSDIDRFGIALGLGLGRGNNSSPAARAEENRLHAAGKTRATADTSAHTQVGGIARDFGLPRGTSDEEGKRLATTLRKQLTDAGIDAQVIYESGKGRNNGTGPHIHVGVRRGTRFTKDRTDNAEAQYDSTLDQNQLALDQKDLSLKLKALAKSTTTETFNATADAAKVALDKVNQDVKNAALNELAAAGIGPNDPRFLARMAQAEQEIAANVEKFQQGVADALVKNLEAGIAAAKRAFDAAIAPAEQAKAVADAQVSGLNYSSISNNVPDYVRSLAAKRAADAAEALDRSKATALPAEITASQTRLADARAQLQNIPRYDESGTETAAWQTANAAIEKQTADLQALIQQKAALDAALGASAQIPKTLGEGLSQAIEAYKIAHNMNNSFAQDLIMNLGGAVDQVSSGLTTMFNDIFTGSKSALGAFGDFAKGIIKYIEQIAAQAVAKQVISLLFDLVGAFAPGVGGGGSNMGGMDAGGSYADSFATDGGFFSYNGGKIDTPGSPYASKFQHFLGGGKVMNGNAGYDSVNAKLARKEWVINSKAAESVGDKFMSDLNQHGAKALDSLSKTPQVNVVPKQEMAVYVVQPDAPPQMGKNDVLVAVQEDILKGGETKKLIKYVSQGG